MPRTGVNIKSISVSVKVETVGDPRFHITSEDLVEEVVHVNGPVALVLKEAIRLVEAGIQSGRPQAMVFKVMPDLNLRRGG